MYKKSEQKIETQNSTLKKKNETKKVKDIIINSRTLFIVFPTLEEFEPEREILKNYVIPELQTYCCDRDIDLECSTFFASNYDYGQLRYLLSKITEENVHVLIFIGDKYGNALLPVELSQEEFNAIQSSALEFSKDVKLLEQCYLINKIKQPCEYNLKDNLWDQTTIEKLREIIQKGAKRAKEDGHLYQINEDRYLRLHHSFIEIVSNALIENQTNNFFVIRKFQAYKGKDSNDKWMESAGPKLEAINKLKNYISSKVKETNYMPYICNIHGYDNPSKWFQNKDSDKYKKELTLKLSTMLRSLLNIPSNLSQSASSYSATPMEIALREHATHQKYMEDITPKKWVERSDIDKKLTSIIEQGMSKSVFIQFYGLSGCGKTAIICRLIELLQQKNCYCIARFAYITDCSLFINELLRNVLLKICEMAKTSPTNMLSSFNLTDILAHFKFLTEKLDRPIFILIDDVHVLKFGKTLCSMEKPLRKLFPKLSFIFTSSTSSQILQCFNQPETFEIPIFSKEQIIEILKNTTSSDSKITTELLGIIRQKTKKSSGNIILAEIQYEELLEGYQEPSNDIEERLARIESKVGIEAVRIVCQLLSTLPYGLTALEVADGYRLCKRNSGMIFDPKDVLCPIPYMVLKYFGKLLINLYTDKRKVWMFRHSLIAQIIRQRYLPSIGEVKLANETMAESSCSVPSTEDEHDPVTSNLVFPQPLNYENGSVNLRRVRYQWYYLLHAGKLELLKETTLCSFSYLEACFRGCGIAHLLTIFEECSQQILDHDILVLFEQVLLPAISTLIRDKDQLVCEVLNRLRFTSNKNSERLNTVIEQLMTFADTYSRGPLLLPLTCWINPPKMKQVVSFTVPQWKSNKTIVQPTHNHQHLLISGNDLAIGQIFMYHIASTLLVKTYTGHTDRVTSICTSYDGQFFTSASHDGNVRLWNFTTSKGESIKNITVSKARIICSILSSDDKYIITGSADSTARVISIDTGNVERAFKDHTGPVVGLQLSSDNSLLVTGSGDFVVMVWDIEVGEIIVKMSGLMAPVTCLAITSNDAFLTVACEDETIRVFSMVSSQELHELTGHEARVNALAASADDCQLFAATKGKVLCYDIHNGQLLETLDCDNNLPVTSLKITDDNSFVLAASGDKIHMWNMNSIERSAPHNEKSKLSCIKLAPDERGAACGTVDSIVAFWDLDLCRCLWSSNPQKNGRVNALDFTTDSGYVISGTEQGFISIWNAGNGFMLQTINLHETEIISICALSDGNRIISCDNNNIMHIWNLNYGDDSNGIEIISTTPNVKGPLYVGKHDSVLIGYNCKSTKEMFIWSIIENKLNLKTKVGHNEDILCYSANKSGTVLVTGSMDQSLKIWQVDSGFLTQILVGHDDVVTCCCVSDDGKTVISGSQDKHIYIWDVQTGSVKRAITARSIICNVQMTQDNSVIISADQDGWIESWSSETSKMYSSFNTHKQIQNLVVSTDASRILVLLTETAQLPILCLHNTPANMTIRQERRTKRIQSASSYASNASEHETSVEPLSSKTSTSTNQPIKSSGDFIGNNTKENQQSTNGPASTSSNTSSKTTNKSNAANTNKKSTLCLIL